MFLCTAGALLLAGPLRYVRRRHARKYFHPRSTFPSNSAADILQRKSVITHITVAQMGYDHTTSQRKSINNNIIIFNASGTHFCWRLSKPQGLVRPEGLGKFKNSSTWSVNPRMLNLIIHKMFSETKHANKWPSPPIAVLNTFTDLRGFAKQWQASVMHYETPWSDGTADPVNFYQNARFFSKHKASNKQNSCA
jgi:hypothetical protein